MVTEGSVDLVHSPHATCCPLWTVRCPQWTAIMRDPDRLSALVGARDGVMGGMGGELPCRVCAKGVAPPLAGLIRELRAVLMEIDQIPGSGEVTPLDLLADKVQGDLAAD